MTLFDDIPTSRTLLVTLMNTEQFYEDSLETIERLDHREKVEHPDT